MHILNSIPLAKEEITKFFENKTKHLLLTGSTGTGKTFLVRKVIEEKGFKGNFVWDENDQPIYLENDLYDFIETNPLDLTTLYQTLYFNKNKIIIFENFTGYSKRGYIELIRSAIDNGIAIWPKKTIPKSIPIDGVKKTKLPEVFEFEGKILIVDYKPRKQLRPLEDSMVHVHLEFSQEDIIKSIENNEFENAKLGSQVTKEELIKALRNPRNVFGFKKDVCNFFRVSNTLFHLGTDLGNSILGII